MAYSKIKGLTVEIGGDTAKLNDAIENSNKKTKNLQTELKGINTLLKFDPTNLVLLTQKQEVLTEAIKTTEEKLKSLKDAQEKVEEAFKKNEITIEQYRDFKREIEATEQNLSKFKKELGNTQDAITNTSNEVEDLGEELEDTGHDAENATDGFTIFKGVISDLTSKVISQAIDKLKELGTELITVGSSFESSMSKVAAVSGASKDELEKLTEKAKEMGASTKFTATEAADAFNYMAMAGWKTEDMIDGIDGIMSLAAASGADLATTSDIVTDALTAMGYSAKDAGRLADVMASASSNANTNVEMMGETFKYAASIAGSLGYSMEDTAIAIGLMANSGIKATQAGTSLRSIMSRIATDTNGARGAMEKLGIEVINEDGSMRNFGDVMADLRVKFQDLSEEEQANCAKTIAGQNALSGFLAIANSSEADFNKLTSAVNNSSGAAKNMADTMQDNLAGEFTTFKSQLEGVYINLYEKVEPALRNALKAMKDVISKIDWNKFGNKVQKALEKVTKGFEWLIKHKTLVINALKLMIGAFVLNKIKSWNDMIGKNAENLLKIVTNAGKAAFATGELTTAQGLLNTAWKQNPIGLVITGLETLLGLYLLFKDRAKEVTDEEKKIQDALEQEKEKINEDKKAWEDLTESQKKTVDAGMTEMSYYENLFDELQDLVDANGKVKEGYEDRASFIVSTLNDALDTEITMTDGVISKYDTLKDSIQQVIDKKKAQIILDSQEELYSEAINKQSEALSNLNKYEDELNGYEAERKNLEKDLIDKQKELNEAVKKYGPSRIVGDIGREITAIKDNIKAKDEDISKTKENYNEQENLLKRYAYIKGIYEHNMALAHKGNYSDMITVSWEAVQEYQNAENAEKAIIEDNIRNQKKWIEVLKSMRNESNKDIIDSQVSTEEKKLQNLEDSLKKYNSVTQEKLNENVDIWEDNLDKQLSELTGANVEFRDAGNNLVAMYVNGLKIGEPMALEEMNNIARTSINELRNGSSGAEEVGKFTLTGLLNGIKNNTLQGKIFSAVGNLGSNVLQTLKNKLKINSPSKATEEIGVFLDEGLERGIEKQEKQTLNKASKFGNNVLASLKSKLNDKLAINTEFNGTRNLLMNTLTKNNLNSSANSTASDVQKLTNLIEKYMPQILNNMGYDIVLDKKVISKQIAPEMNKELGIIAQKEKRGY